MIGKSDGVLGMPGGPAFPVSTSIGNGAYGMSLEACLEAKRELLALPPARQDHLVCVRGTAAWSAR